MGEVQRGSDGALARTLLQLSDELATRPSLWVVEAWIHGSRDACDPTARECMEGEAFLAVAGGHLARQSILYVQSDAYRTFVGPPGTDAATSGTFLIRMGTESAEVLARFPPGETPEPSVSPPATPQPEPSATVSTTTALSGLIGEGGRPLTTAEFSNAWVADPAHLAGRVAIVKGPLPTGYMCWDAGAADASAPPGTCHIGVLEGTIAPEGYWAVKVGADGRLTVLGELKMNGTLFVWSPNQVLADTTAQPDDLLVVQSRLVVAYGGLCDIPSRPCPVALSDTSAGPSDPPPLGVRLGTQGQDTVLKPTSGLVWSGYLIDTNVTSFFLIQRAAVGDTVLAIFNPLVLVAQPG